jgi:cyclophilin family peptidyl-prolyl cis-trans isomerase
MRTLTAALLLALAAPAAAANPQVVLDTSMGKITLELFEDKAPITVKNFLGYVDDKHYDGTVFHRVINGFMVQGGGFESGVGKIQSPEEFKAKEKKTKAPIKNESSNGLSNKKYTLAMARTSEPDSASAQFYINVVDNAFLDKANAQDGVGYCVFGKVVEGQDVVDKIKAVRTGEPLPGLRGVPVEEVLIKSARRK